MAIQNPAYLRVIGGVLDETGASQISVSDGTNIIGGGAVDEQQIILENGNHAYSTINRRAIFDDWSPGAVTSDTASYLYKEATSGAVSYGGAIKGPATVGADRQSVTFVCHYQGRLRFSILNASTGATLASYTGSDQTSPTVESQQLTWSTTTDVVVLIELQPVVTTTDAILWGARVLEDQYSI